MLWDHHHLISTAPHTHRTPRPIHSSILLKATWATSTLGLSQMILMWTSLYTFTAAKTDTFPVGIEFIFYCCCKKLPQSAQHWTSHTCYHSALEARSLAWTSPGWNQDVSRTSFMEALVGDPLSCSFGLSAEFSFLLLEDRGPHFLADFQLSHSQLLDASAFPASWLSIFKTHSSGFWPFCSMSLSGSFLWRPQWKRFRLLRIDVIRLVPPI